MDEPEIILDLWYVFDGMGMVYSLRQIELALWHYYPIWNMGGRERPDS